MTLYGTDLIDRSRAWVSVCCGDLPQARRILTAAAERTAAARMRVAEARLRHDLARLGEAKPAASRLAALAGVADGQYVPALAAHAAALVSGTAADIEAAGSALEALGAALLAAEGCAAAAAAYRAGGFARRSAAAERRAADLAAACGNTRTPGLRTARRPNGLPGASRRWRPWLRPAHPAARSPPGSCCRCGPSTATSRAPTPSSA